MIGHKRRVEDIDGIGVLGLGLVVGEHLGSSRSQQSYKRVVLLLGQRQVWSIGIVPGHRVGYGEGVVRSLYQH